MRDRTSGESIESQITSWLYDQLQSGELNWFQVSWNYTELIVSFEASDTPGSPIHWCTQVFDHLRYGIISVDTHDDAYDRAMKGI